MRFNFPDMLSTYVVVNDYTIDDVCITVTRDLNKAKQSLCFRAQYTAFQYDHGALKLPAGTIFSIIRLFDNNIRLEIQTCPDRYLNKVKCYTETQYLGNLDVEPCK